MRPPPGYPFVGPLPSVPPAPFPLTDGRRPGRMRADAETASPAPASTARSLGAVGLVLLLAGSMMTAGFFLVALMVSEARHDAQRQNLAAAASQSTSSIEGVEQTDGDGPAPHQAGSPLDRAFVAAVRNVPIHPTRFLEGCSAATLDALEQGVGASITRGAPLYNDGDAAGSAAEYERTAEALAGALPASCAGPAQALAEGRATADQLDQPGAQAWAMRDAFDGLLEVIERNRVHGVGSL